MKIETTVKPDAPLARLDQLGCGECFTVPGTPGAIKVKTDEKRHGEILVLSLGSGVLWTYDPGRTVIRQPNMKVVGEEVV